MLEVSVVEWVVIVLGMKINLWTGPSSQALRPLILPLYSVLPVPFSLFG